MRYIYIIILMVILVGMFIFGDHIPPSSELTYAKNTGINKTEQIFCSEEVEKYKKELDQAKAQIESLNSLLKQSKVQNTSLTTYSGK